ncbi:MAG: MBL fold metallo-hydrolase [Clostridiales bacterium]|nr:MBL fold metallo-hydrolase [Clostridiales bacterium]
MKIMFGGGASEVGASFILLQIDGKNIALDCGIRMARDNSLPDFSQIQAMGGVDCILLTHAHMDHAGALPVLVREFPNATLYMTHPTKDLIRVLLYDSLKIMDRRESELPIFAEVHVANMLERIVCFSPNHTFKPLPGEDVTVTYYSAGHVVGACGILISGREGSLFYSGDFSVDPQRTVEGAAFPKLRPDVAIIESTYGDRLHAAREVEEDRLMETVSKVVSRGGKMLIPAFALGRAQEVILLLNRAAAKKQLPEAMQVYVDGMVDDICRVFMSHPNYLRQQYGKRIMKGSDIFYNERVISVSRDKNVREKIITDKGPIVIVSSSGMLTGGPSQMYAAKLSSEEKNFIAITGYQDEESPGRMLLNLAEGVNRQIKIDGEAVDVSCEVGMYGLSAHADKAQIINLAHSLGAKRVLLNHGNAEVVESLAFELQREYPGRVYVPKNGDIFDFAIGSRRASATEKKLEAMAEPPEAMAEFWSFIHQAYGHDKAFTIEDLYRIHWNGSESESLEDFRLRLNASAYFETEKKRPFIYHSVNEADLPSADADVMEVNEALRQVKVFFPAQSGLYKSGARFDDKIILLCFDFPAVQAVEAKKQIEEYEKLTGWHIEVNQECRPAAAELLVEKILQLARPSDSVMTKRLSFYRTENYFLLTMSKPLDNFKEISGAFFEQTGIMLKQADMADKVNAPISNSSSRMEQNQALGLIDREFSNAPHKLYKKSLKRRDGAEGIELSFITKAAGEKYRDLIDKLESRTLWNIWVNPTANQHELIKVAGECLIASGIPYRKISYIPDKDVIQATLAISQEEQALKDAADEFLEKTGGILTYCLK